jgi:hypothetical protein
VDLKKCSARLWEIYSGKVQSAKLGKLFGRQTQQNTLQEVAGFLKVITGRGAFWGAPYSVRG